MVYVPPTKVTGAVSDHTYVNAPPAVNVLCPPDITDTGDAVAVTVGNALTPIKKEPDVAVALPSITTILK
jgi:hypothetical protein